MQTVLVCLMIPEKQSAGQKNQLASLKAGAIMLENFTAYHAAETKTVEMLK